MRRWFRGLRAVEHHAPLGQALRDHLASGESASIDVLRSDGVSYTIESQEFFSIRGRLEALDKRAIRESRGRVLDAGAGAGRHSLALQEAKYSVVAIDVSPLCVEVMQGRGVEEAHVADVFDLDCEEFGDFDTILFLMQSIGIAGSLFGLERLLISLRPLLRPGGQILLDSSPLAGPHSPNRDSSDGVLDGIDVSFSYRGSRGESFSWLYLDEEALAEVAGRLGWALEVLDRTAAGEYLARLGRAEG